MQSITLSELVVLLVEPSPTQHKIITHHLNHVGVSRIDWAQSARTALERLQAIPPDLVISAMHLPDMTGTELLETMRTDPALRDMPFMLISSETDMRYLLPLRQAGVVAILPKPYELEQLKRALYATVDFLEPDTTDFENLPVGETRVLVVDDSFTSRHHVMRLLNKLGIHDIVEAENGKRAAELIDSEYFDFVVTDYNMPEMDGRELVEYIRTHSSQSSIPILMITSESDQSRLAAVEQCGISAICDKPFEAETIKRVLATAVFDSP
jgi:two-component system chemotaxis response regulator CheY